MLRSKVTEENDHEKPSPKLDASNLAVDNGNGNAEFQRSMSIGITALFCLSKLFEPYFAPGVG